MEIYVDKPKKKYPYLAFWTGTQEPKPKQYAEKDIVVISEVSKNGNTIIYVSYLNGNNEGYYTKNEEEYTPLPTGTEIKIIQ